MRASHNTTVRVCRSMKTTAQKQQGENTAVEQALNNTKARHLGILQHPACVRAGAQTKTRCWHCLGLCTAGTLGKGKAGSCTHLFTGSGLYVQFPAGGRSFPCCTAYSTSWFWKHSILKGILLKALVRGLYLFLWTLHSWVPSTEMSDFTGQEILQSYNIFHSPLKHYK